MADTGEDREIKQRVTAHQSETVRESKQVAQRTKQGWLKKNARRNTLGQSPSREPISRTQPDPAAPSDF